MKELIKSETISKLTVEDMKVLSNGCGSEPFDVPEYAFNMCCIIHDIGYLIGGNYADKTSVDFTFFKNMLIASNNNRTIKLLYLLPISVTYYIGVSIFGFLFFNFREEKLTLDNLIDIISYRKRPIKKE
jgi:hypothetical protein